MNEDKELLYEIFEFYFNLKQKTPRQNFLIPKESDYLENKNQLGYVNYLLRLKKLILANNIYGIYELLGDIEYNLDILQPSVYVNLLDILGEYVCNVLSEISKKSDLN